MYEDRPIWRRRRKLAASGLGERDCWAITVDAQRLHARSWEELAVDAYIAHAIAIYQRIRNLDLGAQARMETVEWNYVCLPAEELLARLRAAIPIYEMSDRQLVRMLARTGRH